jgi:hypothetical protein
MSPEEIQTLFNGAIELVVSIFFIGLGIGMICKIMFMALDD